jgi:nitrogen fixation protein NifB
LFLKEHLMASVLGKNNNDRFEHLVKKHPCLGGDAHFKYGRIHLPVSPACNIQCRFCRRSFNKYENRPGVTNTIVSPEESLAVVEKAIKLCPDITVVGIAGPGDPLVTTHALDTFRLIHKKYPKLIKCLSTNGLLLEEYAQKLVEAGVTTVTVTVNAVRPEILLNICSGIILHGIHLTGSEGAEQLIKAQLKGITKMSSFGTIVKINTVLIPGINGDHVEEIAQTTTKAGASLINLIPLIPQNEMKDYTAPTCDELNRAREIAEKHLTVFRHCQHCRADACGIPGTGQDLAGLLYGTRAETFSHG